MRFYGDGDRSPLPIPGDNPVFGKYDHEQELHREIHKDQLSPRDVKPPYLSDEEWEAIKILPGEMDPPKPEWDGKCKGPCCEVRSETLDYIGE